MEAFRHKTALAEILQSIAIALNDPRSADDAIDGVLENVCRYSGWLEGRAFATQGQGLPPLPLALRYPRNEDPDRPQDSASGDPAESQSTSAIERVASCVASTGQPAWEQHDRTPTDGPEGAPGLRMVYGFPVHLAGRVEQVLVFLSASEAPPDEWTIELMGHVGNLLGRSLERIRGQQALEELGSDFESLIHSINGVLWEAQATPRRYTFISQPVERILGFTAEDWLAVQGIWSSRLHPDDRVHAEADRAAGAAERRDYESEYRLIAADGRAVWVRDIVRVTAERDGARLRGVMLDITDRKAAEEALRRSEEQLRHTQKMEAVGALAGGVAHAFNNLLTVVSAQSQLLSANLDEADPIRKRADEIRAAAARGGVLTRQLLTFARKEVWSPEDLDLNNAVTEIAATLGSVLGEDIEVAMMPADQESRVSVDRAHLEQVLFNLSSNARDAMPRGGRLLIEIMNVTVHPGGANGGSPSGACALLTVSDTGHGMDDRTRQRVFEPFFTTKETHRGAGLGLATVYALVERNGGSIDIVSEPGVGTTFRIHLPRVAAGLEAAASPAPAHEPREETILLVEDEEAVRSVSRELLESEGHRVLEATNGVEALRVSAEHEGPIDLLLTDVVMPQMGGGELAERLATERPETRVLFVSGFAGDELTRRGVPDGSAFLHKPFTLEGMSRKIREVLDSPRNDHADGYGEEDERLAA